MERLFQKHYSREEAEALIPAIEKWFDELDDLRHRVYMVSKDLEEQVPAGADAGGELVNSSIKLETRIQTILQEFSSREIQIKDPDRWLIDFPAIIGDREVFLCWQKGESCIEFWHDLDSGLPGRTPL